MSKLHPNSQLTVELGNHIMKEAYKFCKRHNVDARVGVAGIQFAGAAIRNGDPELYEHCKTISTILALVSSGVSKQEAAALEETLDMELAEEGPKHHV